MNKHKRIRRKPMPSANKLAIVAKLSTPTERRTKTTVDTIAITPKLAESWLSPPFQRPLKQNEKVVALSETMKEDGGVFPGILTLGLLDGKMYLIDGQHRKQAFLMSGLDEGYADIRVHHFQSMADMGEEFVNLNTQLVRLQPDDVLRGLEPSCEPLALIRKRCPYVGYDQVRRGPATPVLSMSMVIRTWSGAMRETPQPSTNSAISLAQGLTLHDAEELCSFLSEAMTAFGRDPEYYRLWGSLNLMLCMWLYRRLVLTQYSSKTPQVNKEMFRRCLMSLSADSTYVDWLVGRKAGDRDRSPCYQRIKVNFSNRLQQELGHPVKLPAPDWAHHYPSQK